MTRDLKVLPDKTFVVMIVTYTEWKHKPSSVTWAYVGPFKTAAAAKGQGTNEDEHPVWEDQVNGYTYGGHYYRYNGPRSPSDKEGRRRVDSVVLETECSWTAR